MVARNTDPAREVIREKVKASRGRTRPGELLPVVRAAGNRDLARDVLRAGDRRPPAAERRAISKRQGATAYTAWRSQGHLVQFLLPCP
jgi:hypothetical protein